MSDLVERLAAKREDIPGGFGRSKFMSTEDARTAEARWWLNAIAEELEAEYRTAEWGHGLRRYGCGLAVSQWLREQAREAP